MYEIRSAKNAIREKHKKIRGSIPPDKKRVFDTKICNRIMSLVSYRFADVIMLYAPINNEIDISPVAVAAFASGKKVVFPRCIPDTSKMEFHYIGSLDELKPGTMNIPEPDASAPVFKASDITDKNKCLCIIPALAFDKRGYRIGYGKGYYDRYLSRFECIRAGVIYSELFADQLPNGRFDLKVDFIVSERGVTMVNED